MMVTTVNSSTKVKAGDFVKVRFIKKGKAPPSFAGGRGLRWELAFAPAQQGQEGGATQKQETG